MPPVSTRPLYDPPLDEAERHARIRTERAGDRFICDTLRLARLCARAACRKADICRGHPRGCIDALGDAVPPEVFDWAGILRDARASGESFEEVADAYPDEAAAWRCWVAALTARVTRNSHRVFERSGYRFASRKRINARTESLSAIQTNAKRL